MGSLAPLYRAQQHARWPNKPKLPQTCPDHPIAETRVLWYIFLHTREQTASPRQRECCPHYDDDVERTTTVSRNAWREEVEQTQLVIQQAPDRCFICGEAVPVESEDALIQAYLDAAHQQRLAVVCGQRACRLALEDPLKPTWQRLFEALTHWPDRAIYPHGPYWVIRRPHHLTFRTDPRRTAQATGVSPRDPDTVATIPREEHQREATRPLSAGRVAYTGRAVQQRRRR